MRFRSDLQRIYMDFCYRDMIYRCYICIGKSQNYRSRKFNLKNQI